MGLYEEKFKEAAENLDPVTDIESKSSTAKWEESDRGVWIPEGVIYLVGELADYSLFDFMTRVRTVIRERDEKDADLNLIINSPGGDVSEIWFTIIIRCLRNVWHN